MIWSTLGPIIELLNAHSEGEERNIDILGLFDCFLLVMASFVYAFRAG